MQLQPLEDFVLVRGLEDWTDSTQYYVQAVIRNAKTDALIATIQLTDQGDHHRYSKKWQVPGDPTGLGFYIVIETSVYSDSGYTTKASSYADKYDTFLVQERVNPLLNRGGGDEIDYKLLRKIVQEELAGLPAPTPTQMPEMPNIPFHLQPVLNAIAGVRNDVGNIEMPETDFSGIEFRLNSLETAVKAIKLPENDLSPVLAAISALQKAVQPYTDKTGKDAEAMLERIRQFFNQDIDTIKKQVGSINSTLTRIPFMLLSPAQQTPEEKPKPDYSQLIK